MSLLKSICAGAIILSICTAELYADQPIFNEMPRWDNGWGVQMIQEYRTESDLLFGDTKIGPGFGEDVHILHLEGVYTWDKSVRVTMKFPYVLDARREIFDEDGDKIVQHDEGVGDLTLALPLKRYFNLDQRSGSWTLTPHLVIPLAQEDEYEVYDHEWGTGLSVGYETETYRYVFKVGASAWFYQGEEPFETFASIDLGFNLHAFDSSGNILWENDIHYEDDGSLTLSMGPSFYWRLSDTFHTKIAWKKDFFDRQGVVDHGNGSSLKIGIAVVF